MAATCNDVMSDLRRLLVRLENAEAQAERYIAEMDAQAKERDVTVELHRIRSAICALQVEISVIAAVIRAMAENIR